MRRTITPVSIVIPTLNEEEHIQKLLHQFSTMDAGVVREIIVVDGGSSDRTGELVAAAIARDRRIRWLSNPKRLQSAGINLAVRSLDPATRTIIRLDAHSRYPKDYVSVLLESMDRSSADSIVVPLKSVGKNCVQHAIALASNSRIGTGGSAHRTAGKSGFVDHGHHAAMRRDLFEEVGGYDETFVANEDAELDYRIRRAGGKIWLESKAEVIYFPRNSLRGLARQYWRYGIGRASTFLKHREPLRARQILPPIAVAGVVASSLVAPYFPQALLIPALYLGAISTCTVTVLLRERVICAALLLPTLAVMHFCWGAGFLWHVLIRGVGRFQPLRPSIQITDRADKLQPPEAGPDR